MKQWLRNAIFRPSHVDSLAGWVFVCIVVGQLLAAFWIALTALNFNWHVILGFGSYLIALGVTGFLTVSFVRLVRLLIKRWR